MAVSSCAALADGYRQLTLSSRSVLARPRRGGPSDAARAALHRAGVHTLRRMAGPGPTAPRLEEPLRQPRGIVEDFLLASWRQHRWVALGHARGHFAVVPTPDTEAGGQVLGSSRARLTNSEPSGRSSVVPSSPSRSRADGRAGVPCARTAAGKPRRGNTVFGAVRVGPGQRRTLGMERPPLEAGLRLCGVPTAHAGLLAARALVEAQRLARPPPYSFAPGSSWTDPPSTLRTLSCAARRGPLSGGSPGSAGGACLGAALVPRRCPARNWQRLVWASEAAQGPLVAHSDCRSVVNGARHLVEG